MTSIKTLAIATLPVLALLAVPQAASARGSGFVSSKSGPSQPFNPQNTFSNNLHGNTTNGGVNTNLIQLLPPPATALPKRRNSPRPM